MTKDNLHPVKVKKLRTKAKNKAKDDVIKAIKKMPKKAILSDSMIKGELSVNDYSTSNGVFVSSWKVLKHKPLPTDVFERFDNPLSLQIAFEDYVKWIKKNPFVRPELIRSGQMAGETVDVKIPRPLSFDMFLSFLKMPLSFWNKKKEDENFRELCELIESTIKANIIDAALAGTIDSSFASKYIKLGDTVTINTQQAIAVDISINGKKLPDRIDIDDAEVIE